MNGGRSVEYDTLWGATLADCGRSSGPSLLRGSNADPHNTHDTVYRVETCHEHGDRCWCLVTDEERTLHFEDGDLRNAIDADELFVVATPDETPPQ